MPNFIEIEETFCVRTYMYVRTHGRTFETGFIRSTLSMSWPKMVTRHPAERLFGSEFLSTYNQCRVMDAWSCKTLRNFEKFLRIFEKTTHVMCPESCRVRWKKNAKYGPFRRSKSFKVTVFGTNRKLIYDFQLLINTNLPLAPFRKCSIPNVKNRYIWLPHLRLNLRRRGFPGTMSVKFSLNVSGWLRY